MLVPAIILFTYLFFVIHVSQREKEKRKKQLVSYKHLIFFFIFKATKYFYHQESANDIESVQSETSRKLELHKKSSTASIPSISLASFPSTSGLSSSHTLSSYKGQPNTSKNLPKNSLPKSQTVAKMDLKLLKVQTDPTGGFKKPKPFVKAPSQSHIQVKKFSSQLACIEHEKKKLKKSRSFDKNNFLLETNNKCKTKSFVKN